MILAAIKYRLNPVSHFGVESQFAETLRVDAGAACDFGRPFQENGTSGIYRYRFGLIETTKSFNRLLCLSSPAGIPSALLLA
jgi:hypothetical protein